MKRDVYGIIRKAAESESTERKMSFVASNSTRDAYGTRINTSGWDLERYKKNPIIAYGHKTSAYNDIDNIIGKGDVYMDGEELIVDITFEPEGANQLADKVYQKLQFGTLNAVSVGFLEIGQGKWGEGEEAITGKTPTYYYAGQELLEISVVPIPANPDAVKREFPEDLQKAIDEAVAKAGSEKVEEGGVRQNAEKSERKASVDAVITLARSYEI